MKLIKINTDHYIVVDNSLDFSETDYYWDDKQKEIRTGSNNHVTGGYKIKITHSTQPLNTKFNDWFDAQIITLQEVKELIGEVDVEKKAEKMFPGTYIVIEGLDIAPAHREGFVTGYTQAIEDNKEKKYTEAQLIWAIQEAYGHGQNDEFDGLNKVEKSIIVITNYLQPKTEWEVEFINGKLTLK